MVAKFNGLPITSHLRSEMFVLGQHTLIFRIAHMHTLQELEGSDEGRGSYSISHPVCVCTRMKYVKHTPYMYVNSMMVIDAGILIAGN